MAKRLFQFSTASDNSGEIKPVEFAAVEGGFEADMMLFSTVQNRNHAFFQVSDLMKWEGKLEAIMTNFNHDLKLSSNKYLGNLNKWVKIWTQFNGGALEIWSTFRTEDASVVSRKNEITGPSIELLVDEANIISGKSGEYFTDFDWVGVALLLGVPAGSGGARVSEIRDFNFSQIFNLKNNMQEDEVKALLEAQKQEFATQLEAKFAAVNEVISQSENQGSGKYTWVGEDGCTYEESYESAFKSLVKCIEDGKAEGDSPLMAYNAKLLAKFHTPEVPEAGEPQPEAQVEPELTDEEKKEFAALVALEQAADKALDEGMKSRRQFLAKKMKQFTDEELVTDPEGGAVKTADPEKAARFAALDPLNITL